MPRPVKDAASAIAIGIGRRRYEVGGVTSDIAKIRRVVMAILSCPGEDERRTQVGQFGGEPVTACEPSQEKF
jgi:hypothetical protein